MRFIAVSAVNALGYFVYNGNWLRISVLYKRLIISVGSAMDGLDIDLIDWCGLNQLTDDQIDRLWSETSGLNLLLDCDVVIAEVSEGEELVNYTDVYYRFYVENEADLLKAKEQQAL